MCTVYVVTVVFTKAVDGFIQIKPVVTAVICDFP